MAYVWRPDGSSFMRGPPEAESILMICVLNETQQKRCPGDSEIHLRNLSASSGASCNAQAKMSEWVGARDYALKSPSYVGRP